MEWNEVRLGLLGSHACYRCVSYALLLTLKVGMKHNRFTMWLYWGPSNLLNKFPSVQTIKYLTWHVKLLGISCFCCVFQFIINNQALPCLLALLTNNHKKSIKKEACWTISNITAGNKDQIQVYYMLNIARVS